MTQIYLTIDGANLGPFTIEEVNAKLKSGEIKSSVKSWMKGIEGWVELSDAAFAKIGVVLPEENDLESLPSESVVDDTSEEDTPDSNQGNEAKPISGESTGELAKALAGSIFNKAKEAVKNVAESESLSKIKAKSKEVAKNVAESESLSKIKEKVKAVPGQISEARAERKARSDSEEKSISDKELDTNNQSEIHDAPPVTGITAYYRWFIDLWMLFAIPAKFYHRRAQENTLIPPYFFLVGSWVIIQSTVVICLFSHNVKAKDIPWDFLFLAPLFFCLICSIRGLLLGLFSKMKDSSSLVKSYIKGFTIDSYSWIFVFLTIFAWYITVLGFEEGRDKDVKLTFQILFPVARTLGFVVALVGLIKLCKHPKLLCLGAMFGIEIISSLIAYPCAKFCVDLLF